MPHAFGERFGVFFAKNCAHFAFIQGTISNFDFRSSNIVGSYQSYQTVGIVYMRPIEGFISSNRHIYISLDTV